MEQMRDRAAADEQLPTVCVITHPLSSAGETATRALFDILGALTTVSLLTANLPADSTIRTDHEVIEVSRTDEGTSIPVAAVRFLVNQLRMAVVLCRREEDVALFYGATAYLLPILVARLSGMIVVLEPRGDVPLTLRLRWEQRVPAPVARVLAGSVRLLERTGFALADRVVTYTPSMATELGLDPTSEWVYTDGARYVDTERFAPHRAFDDRETVVGFLGRLDEEKGIRTLAATARQLPDDVTFRFVGDGALSGWLADELAGEIATGNVDLAGWVDHDDVPAELNRMRLLVLPSEPTEGLPTVILEALACGTPVYATPVSGVPDVVHDGETGFLMEGRDPAALAREIAAILEREDLATISQRGRELILEEYSFDAAVERYRTLLEGLR